ncbi:hypothetical protein K470DRAFT_257205 [Piedraia hortae CBS 480.64]|uniref:CFEM domain-containing protein n=1 Tax=Piedraia hortae CBS 480.64 TaxID=1314780 RepID=A0A6A7C183_9PEZI|nr:hypothetical protein K470DRAFT_257205 [Piedraia hortae CBS 480.64]
MKLSLILAVFVSSVTAASVGDLPTCAGQCVKNLGGFGNCGSLDVKCICSNTKLLSDLSCCISKQCDTADQNRTTTFANALCAGQGVTGLPQHATCASSSSTGSASSASATGSKASGSASSTTGSAAAASTSNSAAPLTAKWMGAGLAMIMGGMVAAL